MKIGGAPDRGNPPNASEDSHEVTTPHTITAEEKVFRVVELLENVLIKIAPSDLPSALLVSDAWRQVILTSKAIHRAVVLVPIKTPGYYLHICKGHAPCYNDPIKLHPWLLDLNNAYRHPSEYHDEQCHPQFDHLIVKKGLWSQPIPPLSFATTSAVQAIGLEFWYHFKPLGERPTFTNPLIFKATVYRLGGVRCQDLVDVAKTMLEQAKAVPKHLPLGTSMRVEMIGNCREPEGYKALMRKRAGLSDL